MNFIDSIYYSIKSTIAENKLKTQVNSFTKKIAEQTGT
jgi:hypothetical protein